MDGDAAQKLDFAVIMAMRDNGHLNQMNAYFLNQVACAVQTTDLESLKPYRTLRTSEDHQTAARMVVAYLKKHNLVNALQCVQAETSNALNPKLDGGESIVDLIEDRQANDPHEFDRQAIMTEINSLLGDSGKRRSRHHKT